MIILTFELNFHETVKNKKAKSDARHKKISKKTYLIKNIVNDCVKTDKLLIFLIIDNANE